MDGRQHPNRKQGFLAGIESVRGIAALAVAFGHTMGVALLFNYNVSVFEQPTGHDIALKIVFCLLNPRTAVIVFFVISGLVLGRSLDQRAPLSWMRSGLFIVRRAFRIYPAHIVATIGVLGLLFLITRHTIDLSPYPKMGSESSALLNGDVFKTMEWRTVIGTIVLHNWWVNGVAWSLYVEMWTAPLLPVFHILSRRRDMRLDAVVSAALVGVAAMTWGNILTEYWFAFYFGMLVESQGKRWAEFLNGAIWLRGAVLLAYIAMIMPDLLISGRPLSVVVAEAFCAFTLISLIVRYGEWPQFRLLTHPLVRWNGRLSYSFYLWHATLMGLLAHELYRHASPAFMNEFAVPVFVGLFAISVAVALAVAYVSYRFVERPGIALGHRLEGLWDRRHSSEAEIRPKIVAPAGPA